MHHRRIGAVQLARPSCMLYDSRADIRPPRHTPVHWAVSSVEHEVRCGSIEKNPPQSICGRRYVFTQLSLLQWDILVTSVGWRQYLKSKGRHYRYFSGLTGRDSVWKYWTESLNCFALKRGWPEVWSPSQAGADWSSTLHSPGEFCYNLKSKTENILIF